MMKKRIYIAIALITMVSLLTLAGCGEKQMQLVNEQSFDPSGIQNQCLDYDNDDITIFKSTDGNIVLKEYMDIDKSAYYAKVDNAGDELSIVEGQRPSGNRLKCYVEIYLPDGFTGDVSAHTTNGTLFTKTDLPFANLYADTTRGSLELNDINAKTISITSANGTINLNNVTADSIAFDTSNANIEATSIQGQIQYETSNSSLVLRNATGSGNFKASSDGKIDIDFAEITGNISVYVNNSDIVFGASDSTAFHFSAFSENGSIDTEYPGITEHNDHATGDVGSHPLYTVKLETKNGNIGAS